MRKFLAIGVRSVLLLTAFSYPVLAWRSTSGLPLSIRRFSSHHSCSCVSTGQVRRGSSSSCSTSIHLAARPRGLNGKQVPTCKLERLPRRTLKRAVPVRPTAERWIAYFGQTATERRRKVVDALAVAFVFYWTAFFASRTLLGALAWRVFYFMVFIQGFLRPLVESRSRALELWGAGNNEARSQTKGALFTGRVTQTGFALASEASDRRTHFQMLVEDEEGRELLFDVPQVAEYRDVRKGMRCEVVVLTRSAGFSELTGITEAYLPELEMFVGRFPFLDKRVFGELLDSRDERDRRGGGTAAALPALPARQKRPGKDRRRGVRSSRDDNRVGRGNDLDASQLRRQQERGGRQRAMAVEGSEKGGMVSRRARIR